MWYEIFKFEIQYRARRTDTYLFFAVMLLCSLIAFNFIFEGQNLGLVKENSPYVIAKIMAVVSGFFMIITSMVMGVPILRDFEYNMESLLFVNPITKRAYLVGRFLGSFVVLVFVFSGLIWGMVLGDFMPWRDANNLLPFNFWHYLQPFLTVVLPTLFYGGSIFFVSGALSRKLIVVYTQGLLFFIVAILSHAIEDPFISAILEPFSYVAIDDVVQFRSFSEQNTLLVPLEGVFFYNRIIWVLVGVLALVKGYYAFNFNVVKEETGLKRKTKQDTRNESHNQIITIPDVTLQHGLRANSIQLRAHSLFYFKSILKEAPFWAIVIGGIVTIFINSINIGTAYGVNSYPTTYLIVEDLQEMSLYFFLIILVFYTGELIWQERGVQINGIHDALPISDFINLAGKFIGLLMTYLLLLLALMLSGIAFQTLNGYYHYDLGVYFTGLFLEILPFLTLFTFITFFFQVISNSKFIAHLLVLGFFILIMVLAVFGLGHGLYKFGGIGLESYSDMNGYGHFLGPYLWYKLYWFAFCVFLFVITVIFNIRGTETGFENRWKLGKQRLTKPLMQLGAAAILVFTLTGGYLFYNTHILNTYYGQNEQEAFRVAYEKTLKEKEYLVQPKIVAVNLKVDLYPKERNYIAEGYYVLENKDNSAIQEIHIQKRLSDLEELAYVKFERGATLNNEYEHFGYLIYELNQPLQPGDSIRMEFKQKAITKGFSENDNKQIVNNGTFFDNNRFPSLGYNRKYELSDDRDRKKYALSPRNNKANRDDAREVVNGRSGDDGSSINFEMIIGTDSSQTAIAPGSLQKEWLEGDRKYFHYKMHQPMINFYAIVSARYEVMQDEWVNPFGPPVALEIYYHKGHEYNLDRMMKSMKRSLHYFSKHFSPYPFQQMRIMEYPRYASFAQSFPNTVPYSEAIGFILDIDDEKDIDIPFFITAHELAHQWWGLQVVAANVQGKQMILQSLAQYGALMVMKHEYGEEQVNRVLAMEGNRYQKGKKSDSKEEMPLALVEDQEYIYYSKGAINMYALQDCLTEDSVNLALRRFIKDWNITDGVLQKERFPTSADLIGYFREVTPDSLQYVITDLFESIE
ncbi:MAG: hypothetical protein DHS20C18_45370 [Saprospiraceae bacterium]|nr:MAG: hypothetical protein DHS20C18_45370 [Saprospiraceae bacterium]